MRRACAVKAQRAAPGRDCFAVLWCWQGVVKGPFGLHVEVVKGGMHSEQAWARRFPRALLHLCRHWGQP